MSRARQSVEIVAELGSHEQLGQLNLGLAHLLNQDWNDAARCLEHGLAIIRDRRAQLFQEPLFLIALARAHLGRGDAEAARARAEEAIALAPDRGVNTADAHLVRARALLHSEGTARGEIESAIAAAERFVHSSGAHSRQPAVHELRAQLARLAGDEPGRVRELREAARLFVAMGAARQATRVAEELAGTTATDGSSSHRRRRRSGSCRAPWPPRPTRLRPRSFARVASYAASTVILPFRRLFFRRITIRTSWWRALRKRRRRPSENFSRCPW